MWQCLGPKGFLGNPGKLIVTIEKTSLKETTTETKSNTYTPQDQNNLYTKHEKSAMVTMVFSLDCFVLFFFWWPAMWVDPWVKTEAAGWRCWMEGKMGGAGFWKITGWICKTCGVKSKSFCGDSKYTLQGTIKYHTKGKEGKSSTQKCLFGWMC